MPLATQLIQQHESAVSLQREGFRVGRPEVWLPVQAATFTLLLDLGLRSNHRVLDVGSGLFRVGRPILETVGPENYCAIEPDSLLTFKGMMMLPDSLLGFPVSKDDGFDFQAFNETFDFIVARSIWSHAARWQIQRMMDEFLAVSRPGSVFVASFYAANWWNPRRWPYYGRKWHYKGQTMRPGTRHLKSWIRREAQKRGVECDFRDWIGLGQPWAILRRPVESGG